MKFIFVALIASTTLFADWVPTPPSDAEILLVLRKGAGFLPEPMNQFSECKVYYSKKLGTGLYVMNTRTIAGIPLYESRNIRGLKVDATKTLIAQAANGKILETEGPVDGPTTEYLAYKDGKEIPIHSSGVATNKENKDWSAIGIRNLLDYICEGAPVH